MENPSLPPLYPIRRAMTLGQTLTDSSVIYAERSKPLSRVSLYTRRVAYPQVGDC